MTGPDDTPTPPEDTAEWAATRSTLGEIFNPKPAEAPAADLTETTPEMPVEAAAFTPRDPDEAPQVLDTAVEAKTADAPTPPPAPETAPEPVADEVKPEALEVAPPPAPPAETVTPAAPAPVAPAPLSTETAAPLESPSPAPQPVPTASVPTEEATPVETASAPMPIPAPVAPTPTPTPSPAGVSDDLEEEILTPTAPAQGPQAGAVVDGYHLNEDLGRGWFTANEVTSGPSLDVYVRPDPLWALLLPHKMLPRSKQVGGLHVLEPVLGDRITPPLPAPLALKYATELARLLFALEKQGYAVTDLDPDALRVTPDGLKLRLPPRVAKLGQPSEPVLREGFTPPEVLEGKPVSATSGVYLLGALLYQWLTGRTLGLEGASLTVLGGVSTAGMPQLLNQMLAPEHKRLTPTELLDMLKTRASGGLPAYQVAATTTVGLNPDRPTNEDSYGFNWHQVDADGYPEQVLRAVVSDGMGGMAAGEVASRAAVQAFLNSGKDNIVEMVWDANAAVLDAMQGRDGGCTISAVEVRRDKLELGHVGDSRAYVYQGGELHQISKDHSYVAAMVASGQMTPEEALNSPDRNKVLRSLGSLRQPQPHYVHTLDTPLTLHVGDRVILMSDGVWGEVHDDTIAGMLKDEKNLQAVTDQLIDLALQAGAPDNATALVIERVK